MKKIYKKLLSSILLFVLIFSNMFNAAMFSSYGLEQDGSNSLKVQTALSKLISHYENYEKEYTYEVLMGGRKSNMDILKLRDNMNIFGGLSSVSTSARNIMSLVSVGIDPTDYKGKNHVQILKNEFPKEKSSKDLALGILALDMANADYEKDAFVKQLINSGREESGEFTFGNTTLEYDDYWEEWSNVYRHGSDHASLAALALSKHRDVEGADETLSKALSYLKKRISANGMIYTESEWNKDDDLSATIYTIEALKSLSINPYTSTEWLSSDSKTLLDGVLSCYVDEDEGFGNSPTSGVADMANEIAFMFLSEETASSSVYDLRYADPGDPSYIKSSLADETEMIEDEEVQFTAHAYDSNGMPLETALNITVKNPELLDFTSSSLTAKKDGKTTLIFSPEGFDSVKKEISINIKPLDGLSKDQKAILSSEIQFLKDKYEVYDNYEFLSSPAASLSSMDKEHIKSNLMEYSKVNNLALLTKTSIAMIGAELDPREFTLDGEKKNLIDELIASQIKSGDRKGQFVLNSMDFDDAELQSWAIITLYSANASYDSDSAIKALLKLLEGDYKKAVGYKSIKAESTCLIALGLYRDIPAAASKADELINWLMTQQNNDGGFNLNGGYFANSPITNASVIQGLIANDINPMYNPNWIKNDKTPFDALIQSKYISDNKALQGYSKKPEGPGADYQSTYYAFAALVDMLNDESMFKLIKMSPVSVTPTAPAKIELFGGFKSDTKINTTQYIDAFLFDSNGNLVSQKPSMKILDTDIATISGNEFKALKQGSTKLELKYGSIIKTIDINVSDPEPTVDPDKDKVVLEDKEATIAVRVEGNQGTLSSQQIKYTFTEDSTPFDILKASIGEDNIGYEGSNGGEFINSILGESKGTKDGWSYCMKNIDGEISQPMIGVNALKKLRNDKNEIIYDEFIFYKSYFEETSDHQWLFHTKTPEIKVSINGNEVSVNVKDKADKSPLEGVVVSSNVPDALVLATTDSNGSATFTLDENKTYYLTFTRYEGGYATLLKMYRKIKIDSYLNDDLVKNLSIKSSSNKIKVGDTLKLETSATTKSGSDIDDLIVKWTSSKSKVAKIDQNGLITALSTGNTVIKAVYESVYSETYKQDGYLFDDFDLEIYDIESVSVEKSSLKLVEGESDTIEASIKGSLGNTVSGKSPIFKSSDSSVASVDSNGMVNALKPGLTIITVSHPEDSSIKSTVSVEISKKPAVLKDKTAPIRVRVEGNTSTLFDKTIDYKFTMDSSLSDILERSVGKENIEYDGTDYIFLKSILGEAGSDSESWYSAVETINNEIKTPQVSVSAFKNLRTDKNELLYDEFIFYKTYYTAPDGKYIFHTKTPSIDLSVKENVIDVKVKDAADGSLLQNVVIHANGVEVATTDKNGKATFKLIKNGDYDLSFTRYEEDHSTLVKTHRTISLDSNVNGNAMKSISIKSLDSNKLKIGETLKLNISGITNSGSNTNELKVEWKSSSDLIAKIDQNGLVTAVSPGTATLTARYDSQSIPSSLSDEITVFVYEEPKPEGIDFDKVIGEIRTALLKRSSWSYEQALFYKMTGDSSDRSTIASKIEIRTDIDNPTDLCANIISIIAADSNPYNYKGKNYVDQLIGLQQTDGSFKIKSGSANQTLWSVITLDMAGASYNRDSALAYLASIQINDGSIGAPEDDTSTYLVVLSGSEKYASNRNKALEYIRSIQKPDGQIGNEFSTAYAVYGISASGEDPESELWTKNKNIIEAIMSKYNNGSFGDYYMDRLAPLAIAEAASKKSSFKTVSSNYYGERLDVNTTSINIVKGEKQAIKASIKNDSGDIVSSKSLVFKSSDSNIASIDSNGTISALNAGECTISVIHPENPNIKVDITVKVTDKETEPEESPDKTASIRIRVEGNTSTLFDKTLDYTFTKNSTPFDILKKSVGEENIIYSGSEGSEFVTSIFGESSSYDMSSGASNAWMYCLKSGNKDPIASNLGMGSMTELRNDKNELLYDEFVFYKSDSIYADNTFTIYTKMPNIDISVDKNIVGIKISDQADNTPLKNVTISIDNKTVATTGEDGSARFNIDIDGEYELAFKRVEDDHSTMVKTHKTIKINQSEGEVIKVDKTSLELLKNEQAKLDASIKDSQGDLVKNKLAVFKSLNPEIASVDENGLVKAVKIGTATIAVAHPQNPNIKVNVIIDVVNKKDEEILTDDTAYIVINGPKGKILSKYKMRIKENDNVISFTARALDKNDINYRITDGGRYVAEINGIREKGYGNNSGWKFYINGKPSEKGGASVDVENSMKIEWRYTTDYTKDKDYKNFADQPVSYEEKAQKLVKKIDKLEKEELKERLKDITALAGRLEREEDARILEGALLDVAKEIQKENTEESKEIMDSIKKVYTTSLENFSTVKIDEDNKLDRDKVKESIKLMDKRYEDIQKKLEKANIKDVKLKKELVLDFSELDSKSVTIDSKASSALKDSTSESISIKTEDAKLELKKDFFEDKDVKLEVKKINTKDHKKVTDRGSVIVDIALDKGKNSVSEFDQPIKISIPYKGIVTNPDLMCVYSLDEQNKTTKMGGIYNKEDGTITFETTHLSKYFAKVSPALLADSAEKAWAEKSIDKMAAKGILEGYDGKFNPSNNMTKAEFVTMTVRLVKLKSDKNSRPRFADVDSNAWYYKNIQSAIDLELIEDASSSNFNPDMNINREEAAMIVFNALRARKLDTSSVSKPQFNDASDISSASMKAVMSLRLQGLLKGDQNNNFNPKAPMTRAECAVFIDRLYDHMMNN